METVSASWSANGLRVVMRVLALCGVLAAGVNGLYGPARAADQPDTAENGGSGPIRILALGDSLTAGYGLDDPGDAFQAKLETALRDAGYDVSVLPGGVSGDTTAGGLARLDWSLAEDPDAVLIALGGNDLLRGIEPSVSKANLEKMIETLKAKNLPVMLAGMRTIANWGRDYEQDFNAIYPALADKHGVILFPFFLEDVAGDPDLNQADGLHPTAEGVDVMVENILPYVKRLIAQVRENSQT